MMIRDYKHLIKLQHIHTEQMHLKYAKARSKVLFFMIMQMKCLLI